MFGNIPLELQQLRQWINWKYETVNDRQTKIPLCPVTGFSASVINPLHWSSFDNAVVSSSLCDGIGFVFTKSDVYCGIDLDNPEANQEIIRNQNEIFTKLDSYSEYSPSGNGLHIIVKASLSGAGRRCNKIECYDNLRFFTFTGNVFNNKSVQHRQSEIDILYSTLGKPQPETPAFLINEVQIYDDDKIISQASNAINGAKFTRLYNGNWQSDYGAQSQSEADFALINIISFYTKNRVQIYRIFRSSGLGKREKANRSAYINWMIDKSFDRMPPKADVDMLYNQRLEIISKYKVD